MKKTAVLIIHWLVQLKCIKAKLCDNGVFCYVQYQHKHFGERLHDVINLSLYCIFNFFYCFYCTLHFFLFSVCFVWNRQPHVGKNRDGKLVEDRQFRPTTWLASMTSHWPRLSTIWRLLITVTYLNYHTLCPPIHTTSKYTVPSANIMCGCLPSNANPNPDIFSWKYYRHTGYFCARECSHQFWFFYAFLFSS